MLFKFSFMKMKFILSIFLVFSGCFSWAQTGKLLTVNKELSSSIVVDVFQDRNDLIWIATENGLNRYDGSKFTVYKQEQGSLLHNFVRLLFEDSRGNFYIGYVNGLQLYDYASGSFKEIPLLLESGIKFDAHVLCLLERQNGDILVGTSGPGLFSVHFDGDKVYAKQDQGVVPSNLINYLYEDKDQNLWVSTQDKGLFRVNKEHKLKNFSEIQGMKVSNISSVVEDQEGNLYVGSLDQGLFLYDSNSDSFSSVPYPGSENLPINTLYPGKDGNLYIGTEGKGIKVYHPVSGRISDYNFFVPNSDFSKAKVSSIIEDKAGNIWAGIFQKGVIIIPESPNNFRYMGYKSIRNNTIGAMPVTAVFKDQEGILWVGTDGDGIYGLGPDGRQIAHFEHTGQTNSVPSTILSIYEDSKGDLWIGSYLNGMAKVDRKTGKCTYVKELLNPKSEAVQRVFALKEDQEKNLWIGTMGAGLYQMDLKTRKITHYNALNSSNFRTDANSLHNAWIECLLPTSEGKLYIGTYDGLGCMDLKTRDFVSKNGTNRLLAGHIVYALYEDQEGTIWIGTDKGLMYIKKNAPQIHAYTIEDGLPSNVIGAVQGDREQNIWVSTNSGISKIGPKENDILNFYADDGLQGNEFSKGAAFKDKEGQIFFGGLNGLTYFKPEDIKDQGRKPGIRITDFYLHDQPVYKGMKSGSADIIETSVKDAEVFHLAHKDNSFTIEFSTMEFLNPERIIYKYSMQDGKWISLRPGTNNVTFHDLAPGEYTFKVKAKDYNAYSVEKKIGIVISPAWYFSPLAKLFYFLGFAAFVVLVIQQVKQRYRTRKKMQEHIQAKQINEAKLQFFINIAHEIRTPMSLIISPLNKLMNNDKDSGRQRSYSIMHRNSERILLLIKQLMDIRKIDKGQMYLKFQEIEIVDYIRDLCTIFDEQTQSKQIELQFRHELEKLDVWVDPKNFDKVVLNIIGNAIKFTPEKGNIKIDLSTGEDPGMQGELQRFFEISISDTGMGINEKDLEHIFECFFQTETSKTNFSGGTGIGLHLSRSIVQLHYGTIKAENNKEGKGSRFIIRLPLGKNHLREDEVELISPVIQETKPQALPITEPCQSKVKSKSKHRVLVVDDDEEIRKYICQELASEYHMLECANGKEALSLVLKNAPDLIISDVMMPEMDGITLCRKIKQHVKINHVPVILLTAKSEEADNLEGIATGADAYIVKPFNIEILSKTVQNIIKNREMLRNNYSGNQHQEDKIEKVQMKSADEKLLEKIMQIISKNLENPSLSVEMLAREVGISRVHLHRKTKELTNQSTRDLIRNTRLQQAANLLSGKLQSITEVAFAVGFTSPSTFSNVFKEFYGVSPTSYMQNHLKPGEKAPEVSHRP